MAVETPIPVRTPRATYRLQFHEGFRLEDAAALVPYLHELGISHIYASPLTTAAPHSQHGYDVCDFQRLNPELGSEDDLRELVEALHFHNMGLVLDIVPNHMAASVANPWWQDVLAHGRQSEFAQFYDVDWEPADPRNRGKILLPVLGVSYAEALANHEIQIKSEGGVATVRYGGNAFPVTLPAQSDGELEQINGDPLAVDQVIRQQNYRLTWWKCGDSELNYRRFFNIASLVGVRVEEERVFAVSHWLFKKWVDEKWVDGLRVDHPDGLRDPAEYLWRLRELAPEAWIVIEKILLPGEALPAQWPVAGTTGYDFLNRMNSLFVDEEGGADLTAFYHKFTGRPLEYAKLLREKKHDVLSEVFTTEINRLLQLLLPIADRDWRWRDFARDELRAALIAFIAGFPVYRTYRSADSGPVTDTERAYIDQAVNLAKLDNSHLNPELFNLLGAAVVGEFTANSEFIPRFQQLTGPAMAKGGEDRAFYCYNRFVSLNEVGGDPGHFGSDPKAFHDACQHLQSAWPESMLASTTHDTKRGEDLRARLDVLSEIPDQWRAAVERWSALNQRHRHGGFTDRNAEYFIYQTLVGAWPVSVERLQDYLEKAAREAGEFTNWKEPDVAYEQSLRDFLDAIMLDRAFLAEVEKFVAGISRAGFVNSLSQTLLKLTAPGVPDIYQGCELWNFSLVDPDNRRPVDFKMRQHLLRQVKGLPGDELWKSGDGPMVKLWLTWKVLSLRAERPGLFLGADYTPLYATGEARMHLVAFKRGDDLITLVPRLPLSLRNRWRDSALHLPEGEWWDIFTGEKYHGRQVPVQQLLERFPVALLVRPVPPPT